MLNRGCCGAARLSQLADFDEVQSQITKASRMSTTPEGAG